MTHESPKDHIPHFPKYLLQVCSVGAIMINFFLRKNLVPKRRDIPNLNPDGQSFKQLLFYPNCFLYLFLSLLNAIHTIRLNFLSGR